MAKKNEVEPSLAAPDTQQNAPETDGLLKISKYVIIAMTILAYLTSFQGAFVFDDFFYIDKPLITNFWSAMTAPETVSRPLIGLTLAINYAISGRNPWSYHVFNLLIHLAAALALFGIVRHTLLSQRLREEYGKAASPLALVVALVWAVHPLNTQAVTYIIQRCESLMGMFYLLTLYCAIRSFKAKQKMWWYIAAIAACTGGTLSKQVIVTAPIMVFIYDWLFVAASWKEILRNRWKLYAGLCATWIVLAATMIAAPVSRSTGFALQGMTSLDYFKSQFGVIVYYLRLALWPDVLCLDYAWPKARTAGDIVPYVMIVGLLVAATLWALYRRKPISFLGIWFFLIIALTSSFLPIDDLIFEYRMYLSLAAVVTLLVLGAYYWGKRLLSRMSLPAEQMSVLAGKIAFASALILITWLAFLTAQRNFDYKSDIGIWRDVISKRPQNPRAHNNVGSRLMEKGVDDEAIQQFLEACKYKPDYADAHTSAGWLLSKRGDLEEGKRHLSEALTIMPLHETANFYRGKLYLLEGNTQAAIECFSNTLKINPKHELAYFNMGKAWENEGNFAEAIKIYRNLHRVNPQSTSVMGQLAFVLATSKDATLKNPAEALQLAETAVSETREQQSFPLEALAAANAELKRFPEAVTAAQKAISLASAIGDQETVVRLEANLKQYKENQKL
jgi:protein O-mannosyl-transferase